MFVALEGIDGCGKTTLAKELKKRGYTITQEPFLECTREIIAKTGDPETRETAFYVDRLYHIEQFILPKLKKGGTVVTDRYKYSQIAYAFARYRGTKIYERALALNKNLLEPDIVIFLDISPELALERKPSLESDAKPFLKKGQSATEFLGLVRKKYTEMKDGRWVSISAEKSKKEILGEVIKAIQ